MDLHDQIYDLEWNVFSLLKEGGWETLDPASWMGDKLWPSWEKAEIRVKWEKQETKGATYLSLAGAMFVCALLVVFVETHSLPFGDSIQIFFSFQHGKHEVPKYDTFLFATNT